MDFSLGFPPEFANPKRLAKQLTKNTEGLIVLLQPHVILLHPLSSMYCAFGYSRTCAHSQALLVLSK